MFLILEKIYKIWVADVSLEDVRNVTEQPLFYLALVAIIIGVQLFLAGFLGELIHLNKENKDEYLVSDRVNN